MIHHITPFSEDKNLGRSYNRCFEMIGKDDWICLRDCDTLFLTPNGPSIIESYVKLFPQTGIFTCFTNRVSPMAQNQLHEGKVSEISDIRHHIAIAERMKHKKDVTELKNVISGMLMVISKKTWEKHKFDESGKALGVDHLYSRHILDASLKIYRMNGVYVWHSYRLLTGIHSRKHLM